MFAALQTFLPEESGQRAAEDADESLLEGLAVSPTLAQHFQGKIVFLLGLVGLGALEGPHTFQIR